MPEVNKHDRLKTIATALTRRLVGNSVRVQFVRHSLEGAVDAAGQEFVESEMVADAVALALGEDTGCLGEEELNSENIELLHVEQLLRQVETDTRDRCYHDFLQHIRLSLEDCRSVEGREALMDFGAGVYAQGPGGLGEWRNCKCGEEGCPNKRALPGDPSRRDEVNLGTDHNGTPVEMLIRPQNK